MRHLSIITLVFILLSASFCYGIDKKFLVAAGIQELKQEAPDFTVVERDGKKVRLQDYKGTVVIIHIWATWCKPCHEEFPLFEKMYRRFMEKNIAFLPIAIDIKATQDEINTFAKEHVTTFPVYLARIGNITDKYWTWGVPVTYFIDKKGWIAGRAVGPRDWASDSINNLINALLEEK